MSVYSIGSPIEPEVNRVRCLAELESSVELIGRRHAEVAPETHLRTWPQSAASAPGRQDMWSPRVSVVLPAMKDVCSLCGASG